MTPYIIYGGQNVVAVRVDNSDQPNSRWYTGSGIYRGSGATRSQGTNSSGQYRGQSNNRNNYNNYNDRNDNNSFRQNSTPSYTRGGSSGYSGGYSGGGNSSGMSHGGGQRRR